MLALSGDVLKKLRTGSNENDFYKNIYKYMYKYYIYLFHCSLTNHI